MHLLPIDRPTNPSSDIFNGDHLLGFAIGTATFCLILWYAAAPSALSFASLLYGTSIPVAIVALVFFSKLYIKNVGHASQMSMLMPLVALGITFAVSAFVAWPSFVENVEFILKVKPIWSMYWPPFETRHGGGNMTFMRILILGVPFAESAVIWLTAQMLLPGKWWKQLYT